MVRTRYGARAMRLDLLSAKPLRAAVIEARPDVEKMPTERQFRRYIGGDTPWPGWLRSEVEKILGTTKRAAPEIPERLENIERWLSAIAVATGVPPDEVEDLHQRVDELEQALRRRGGSRRKASAPSRDG